MSDGRYLLLLAYIFIRVTAFTGFFRVSETFPRSSFLQVRAPEQTPDEVAPVGPTGAKVELTTYTKGGTKESTTDYQEYNTWLPPRSKPTRLVFEDREGGIWVYEQPFAVFGLNIRARMSILRLRDGHFAVYSPLAPTKQCIDTVKQLTQREKLGHPKWFIVPNYFPQHHEYLIGWRLFFPEASVLSSTTNINVIAEYLLNSESDLPPPLRQDFDVAFLRSSLLREALYLHKPSRTILTAESGAHLSKEYASSPLGRYFAQWLGVWDRFASPLIFRLGIDKAQGKLAYDRVKKWPFKRIVPCHGTLVTKDAKQTWLSAYAHLDG